MTVEGYVDIQEAAAELGVSEATMWNLIRHHEIDRYRIPGDRRTRIKREDLQTLRQPIKLDAPKRGRPRGSGQGKATA